VAIFAPLASGDGRPELAFAVSKRCGGAVERNLIRRRLRAAADHLAADLRAGAYLVRTDPGVLDLTYAEVIHNLRVAVAKATKTSKELSNGA
jgi:ribonuclease P protein component